MSSHPATPPFAALAIAILGGCSGDLSNAAWLEDAEFYAALPDWGQLDLSYPSDPGDLEEESEAAGLHLLEPTLETLEGAATWVALFGAATDPLKQHSPSERGEDYRVIGPLSWDASPGSWIRAEMSRTSDRSFYTYAFQVSPSSAGPWSEFLTGIWDAAGVAEDWQMQFSWDQAALSEVTGEGGETGVTLSYRTGETVALLLEVDGPDFEAPAVYRVELFEDGGGSLSLEMRVDLVEGEQDELLLLETAWGPGGEGEGEATLSGGDMGLTSDSLRQCWDAEGVLLYSEDEEGWLPVIGTEEDCAAL